MQPINFINNLQYMFYGLITIFAVIGVIIIITILLNKIPDKKD